MLVKSVTLAALLALPGSLLDASDVLGHENPPPRPDWERVDTTPRTGYYLDIPTRTLHYYDAGTDTLTSTGTPSIERRYANIDVYARGDVPEPGVVPNAQAPLRCDRDFCISMNVMIVGADHAVTMLARALGECSTKPFEMIRDYPPSTGKVTYIDGQWGVNYCTHGRASAEVRLDTLPADADFEAY